MGTLGLCCSSSWIGQHFEYEEKENTDLVVRFCKDVEKRSQTVMVVDENTVYNETSEYHHSDI
ncbi:conserved hypothetical protein [Ricinus communis]|uniref:Uncharacterized protein n=1 Tax=Ricinus communis TaxID=3988 RepID=B9S695_RICCO|nr:conserved hypothetical protein [Ricinus communis]